ncbi:MAG TPA: XdhC family protein, partial [Burkholderiaceae bacterium]
MSHWLDICCDMTAPCVLVTVAAVDGSGPRESGAKMIVTADSQIDTIGGGHLELKACEMAREMLRHPVPARRFERFALGPGLGQCCGGVVYLALEVLDCAAQEELALVRRRLQRGENTWRLVPLDESLPVILLNEESEAISQAGEDRHAPRPQAGEGAGVREVESQSTFNKRNHMATSLATHPSPPSPPCPDREEPLATAECRSGGQHADRNPDYTTRGRGEHEPPVVFTSAKP